MTPDTVHISKDVARNTSTYTVNMSLWQHSDFIIQYRVKQKREILATRFIILHSASALSMLCLKSPCNKTNHQQHHVLGHAAHEISPDLTHMAINNHFIYNISM